jgi:hypothetical protein
MRGVRVPAVALVALLVALGVAQPAPGAETVRRAKLATKAKNSARVGGIAASRQPRPGRLLALGRDGRFPASVLSSILDSSLVQRPLTRQCPTGQSIRALTRQGAVSCSASGNITSITAGEGLAGGGSSGAVELAIAPPLVFNLGATAALLDLTNIGSGEAIKGESGSPFATAYFRGLGTGSALRADTSAGAQGNAATTYNYGTNGFGLAAELINPLNPKAAIFARTAGGGQAIDAEMNSGTGPGDALYARSSSNHSESYAGFFSGNVNVTGTLTKMSGNFRIDHPLDPANRYLQHSFVESPDMKNIYDGVARTDGRGYATVRLPRWFQALNKDFRYQLTTIRSFARAIVWRELRGNSFVVRTQKPRVKVSWQVTGVRDDAYARAHRTKVEIAKPRGQRGRFLAPEELGKPKRLQITGR